MQREHQVLDEEQLLPPEEDPGHESEERHQHGGDLGRVVDDRLLRAPRRRRRIVLHHAHALEQALDPRRIDLLLRLLQLRLVAHVDLHVVRDALARHDAADEEVDDAAHEVEAQRRGVADAPPGVVLDGEQARAPHQRPQRAPQARLDLEQLLEQIAEEARQRDAIVGVLLAALGAEASGHLSSAVEAIGRRAELPAHRPSLIRAGGGRALRRGPGAPRRRDRRRACRRRARARRRRRRRDALRSRPSTGGCRARDRRAYA